jgi:hypothetical protein
MAPERCSIMINGKVCSLPPSRIVSILLEKEEYMVGLVCNEHIMLMKTKALSMQKSGKINRGKIRFQKVKPVMTDCILNLKEMD